MKNWFFIAVFLVLGAQSYAQGMNISLVAGLTHVGYVDGRVIDANSSEENLVFATVTIKELDMQVVETDMEGSFSFELLPGSYTLQVSFIGYETQEVVFEVYSGATTNEEVFLQSLKTQSAQLLEPIEAFSLHALN